VKEAVAIINQRPNLPPVASSVEFTFLNLHFTTIL